MVVQWVTLLPQRRKVWQNSPASSFPAPLLCVQLPRSLCTLSGFSVFLSQSKHMLVRLIGDSQLVVVGNVLCVSICYPACTPALNPMTPRIGSSISGRKEIKIDGNLYRKSQKAGCFPLTNYKEYYLFIDLYYIICSVPFKVKLDKLDQVIIFTLIGILGRSGTLHIRLKHYLYNNSEFLIELGSVRTLVLKIDTQLLLLTVRVIILFGKNRVLMLA